MTLHIKKCTTDGTDACDSSAMEKTLVGAAAARHVDNCTTGEVGLGCQKMANDRPSVTRAKLISALEGVRDADDRLHRLKRRTFWGLAWRRSLIMALLLLYAFEVWRQAQ